VTPPDPTQTASPNRATILLVDDEPTLRDAVGYSLRREGYAVALAADGVEALASARAARPDLVVLDVMLPGMDGLQVCRTLRAESTVPILLLSAKGEEIDRVVGLELGADDYLTKPFAMRELLARVRAMLRRAGMAAPADGAGASNGRAAAAFPGDAARGERAVVVGDLAIDPASRTVTRAGVPLILKPKEFDLLHYLARHPGIALSRDALLRRVWGYDYPVDTRTVDVHVRWLRQKIEEDPARPRRIETVRGHGYRFAADAGSS
jgi:two-component system alkaline phosphatase synthesis response regulator PhoP